MAERSDIHLAGRGHDRRAERRVDDAWLEEAWSAARILPIAGSRLHVVDGAVEWLDAGSAPAGVRIYLGESADGPVFAVVTSPEEADETWHGLRAVVPHLDSDDAGYVVHAIGLAEWQWATRHCPRCGGHLTATHAGHVLRCDDCDREQFPRTDPAVIMRVLDADDRILLGRQAAWPPDRWSTLAGFLEPGESLEQAVRREVFEEAGVRVGEVDYFGSQPWPLPASLMVGFTAHAETTEIDVDGDEIEVARWWSRDEASAAAASGDLLIPPGISISRTLITDWFGAELPGTWR